MVASKNAWFFDTKNGQRICSCVCKTAQKEKTEYETQLAALQQELNDFNQQLETANSDLQSLKDTRTEIETEIANTCNKETKDALDTYQTARDNLDNVKQTEETAAEQAIQDSQNSITEVEKALNT